MNQIFNAAGIPRDSAAVENALGHGFLVTLEQAVNLLASGSQSGSATRIRTELGDGPAVIFDYRNGRDFASRPRGVKVIDRFGLNEAEVRERYTAIYQHLRNAIRHKRQSQAAKSKTLDGRKYAEQWWLFRKSRPEIRKALRGVSRYIATIETAKHRVFHFLTMSVLPDNMLVCTALDDADSLGVLSSSINVVWAWKKGSRLEDRARYNKAQCFDPFPFPFPADVPELLKERIRVEAEALDALRKRVLADHADLTLTRLYNVLEALRADGGQGRALTMPSATSMIAASSP
jgi:hypothetical protein